MQALARRKPDNPELMPLVKPPQNYVEIDAALPSAVNFGPAERAKMVKASTDICEKRGVLGAGYIPKFDWVDAGANSEGLFTYFHYADASFILTCRTPDQTGSGWAGTTGVKDIKNIDAEMLTNVAADKALKSRKPRAIEPGNYTVILEPRPAARYLSLMLGAFNARNAEEGRSFMSGKQRGETRLGRKSVRRQLHAAQRDRQSDPAAVADRPGRPRRQAGHLGREGRRQEPLLRSLLGAAAEEGTDRDHAGHEPGDGRRHDERRGDDQDDQARPAGRRSSGTSAPVDNMTLLNTGMTRDGLFLIENGEIVAPVQNFRWNESPAVSFNNITALGPSIPMHTGEAYDNPGTALVPAMRLEDFTMTSISPAV